MLRRILLIAVTLLVFDATPASANHSITDLLSTGPAGGNGAFDPIFRGASADGTHVLFQTDERLVSADTDSTLDVYERVGGTTTLVSIGPAGGNGPFVAGFDSISEDGSHSFFSTQEQLVAGDADSAYDLYERSGGTTTLVSVGTAQNTFPAMSSADGSHVFFETSEQLEAGDTDARFDVYERFDGATTLVSTGPAGGNGDYAASVLAVSADGSRVIFRTSEQLTGNDTDGVYDIYARSGSTTELLSTGMTGGNPQLDVSFGGASRDAATVAFRGKEWCYPLGDCEDVWVNSGGTTHRVSGPGGDYAGISKNGQHVFYWSANDDAPGSYDYCGEDEYGDYFFGCPDLFDYSGGSKRTVSAGGVYDCSNYNTPFSCYYGYSFGGASADGTRVFFTTIEALTSEDGDACLYAESAPCRDVYENSAAEGTKLVSKRTDGAASYAGNSDDGTRVFYVTLAPEAASDTDNTWDIYERHANATTLISTGPTGGNGNFIPTFKGASTDGTRVFFEMAEKLVGSDLDSNVDLYQSSVGTGYPRPKGATPMRLPLVPAFKSCASPNSTHGAPLSFGSCSPPVPEAASAFIGIGDGNPAPSKSIGWVEVKVLAGTPGGGDDADVRLRASITNVMKTSDRSDYGGELRLELPVRITDRLNDPGHDPGTGSDTSVFATIPCAATPDPTLGAACSVLTTADSLAPGSVREGARSVWAVDEVKVHDGGTDGDAETQGDNELFAVQGVFAP